MFSHTVGTMLPARKQIGENIKAIATKRGMSLGDVAERAGISRRVLGKVTAGRENYRIDIFESIANGLRVPGWQLLAGTDQVRDERAEYKAQPGVVSVPRLDIEASAGHGSATNDNPAVLGHLELPEWWLRQVLGIANHAELRVIDSRGDSMSPTINHGDIVFVDTAQQQFDGEGIYIIVWNDQLLIKRLRVAGNHRIGIHSDNGAYPPEYIQEDNEHALSICGRVVGWWTLRRY